MMNIVKGYKKRLDALQEIVSPARAKKLSECSDADLLEIILAGCKGAGKNGGPLTVQNLNDEKLVEIITEGKPLIILDGGCEPCR